MIKLDKIKIVSSINNIRNINEDLFQSVIKKGAIAEQKYTMLSPYSLYVECDYFERELIIEFTGKLLWDKLHRGDCVISTHYNPNEVISTNRPLLEDGLNVFIRDGRLVSIMNKVKLLSNQYFSDIVSANDPFGFDVREKDSYKRKKIPYKTTSFDNSIPLYYNGWNKNGVGYVSPSMIRKNIDLVTSIKFYIPKAWGNGDISNDRLKPLIVEGDSCCTETYLTVGAFSSIKERDNAIKYTQTKFFHILVFILKNTQNTMQKAYSIVPMQDFTPSSDIDWNKSVSEIDMQLYTKYGLNEQEIAFIESIVKR